MKSYKLAIALLLIILVIVAGCANNPTGLVSKTTTNNKDPIKIGSILILSGQGASWGTAAKNGIDMAVEDINNQGGINGRKLIIDHQDDESNAKKAISAYDYLVNVKNTKIIIGTTWSHTGLPLIQKANYSKILMISPSLGMAKFNEDSKYLFNTWPHDEILSAKLADYVFQKGHKKVAMIGAEQIWVKQQTNAFKNRFEKLGGEVIVLVEPNPSNKNVNTESLKIKQAQNQATAIVSTTDGILVGSLVAKRSRELGVTLPIFSITIDLDTIKAADGAYEGLEFLTFLTPTKEFQSKYETKYNMNIDIGASSAYDATMLIAKAIEKTRSTNPEQLQLYLNSIETYKGVSGDLIADSKGGFIKKLAVKKVINNLPVDITA